MKYVALTEEIWQKFLADLYERMSHPRHHFGQSDPDGDWEKLQKGDTIRWNIDIYSFCAFFTQDRYRNHPQRWLLTGEIQSKIFGAAGMPAHYTDLLLKR